MSLTPHDIARMLDHSTLQPFLTEDDIRRGCGILRGYLLRRCCQGKGQHAVHRYGQECNLWLSLNTILLRVSCPAAQSC